MKNIFDLIGRLLMSVIFYFEAYDKIFFMAATRKTMSDYHIFWHQDLLIYGSCFCLILGATLITIGYRSGFGALLILLYWIPLTFILDKFWEIPLTDHETRRSVSLHFMKNIAIMGGLLMIYVHGTGKYSVRRLLSTTRVLSAKTGW
jgi:putative oxidoreductase